MPVIGGVLFLLLAVGLMASLLPTGRTATVPSTAIPTLGLASVAAPVGSESSSWYCTGSTGTPGGIADATLSFVNTGHLAVSGTVTVVNATGQSATRAISLPGGRETNVSPEGIQQGNWLASTVQLDGGGVTVSEIVEGSAGWSEAPCATRTNPDWYFATGSTELGDLLFDFVYNPGAVPAVVDLKFVSTQGESAPEPFEGLVIAPGSVVVAGVGSFVQNQQSVATLVQAQSGSVVAAQLEQSTVGSLSGLSLLLGSPRSGTRWSFPRTVNTAGGQVSLGVLNPSSSAQFVRVEVDLASGPAAPFVQEVAPDSTWNLLLSGTTRIPQGEDYTLTVVSRGGGGVVVGRVAQSSSTAAPPQWGMQSGIAAPAAAISSRKWVIPSPSVPGNPPEPGAVPYALAIQNTNGHAVSVRVDSVDPDGPVGLASVPVLRIPPRSFLVIEASQLMATSSDALLVVSSGPVAVMEDDSPAGAPGIVSLAGIPLAA
ncbi:MAG: DUF5719 family protein [Actinomycetota bacterium]|jgi:hypothetical protein|nr:DUF5719 family protein [Actinomycetota bacterium]